MRALLLFALALASCAAPPVSMVVPADPVVPALGSVAAEPSIEPASSEPAASDIWLRGLARPRFYGNSTIFGAQTGPQTYERSTGGYGGFEVYAGYRALPRASFDRVRTQAVWGGSLLVPVADGPIAVELGAAFSRDKDESGGNTVTLDGRVIEASVGLRLSINARSGTLVPYVGGGLTTIYARIEDEVLNELRDDTSLGLYGRVGLAVYVGDNEYLALEWRGLRGTDVDLFSSGVSANYDQVSVVFGTSW